MHRGHCRIHIQLAPHEALLNDGDAARRRVETQTRITRRQIHLRSHLRKPIAQAHVIQPHRVDGHNHGGEHSRIKRQFHVRHITAQDERGREEGCVFGFAARPCSGVRILFLNHKGHVQRLAGGRAVKRSGERGHGLRLIHGEGGLGACGDDAHLGGRSPRCIDGGGHVGNGLLQQFGAVNTARCDACAVEQRAELRNHAVTCLARAPHHVGLIHGVEQVHAGAHLQRINRKAAAAINKVDGGQRVGPNLLLQAPKSQCARKAAHRHARHRDAGVNTIRVPECVERNGKRCEQRRQQQRHTQIVDRVALEPAPSAGSRALRSRWGGAGAGRTGHRCKRHGSPQRNNNTNSNESGGSGLKNNIFNAKAQRNAKKCRE